MLNPKFFNFLLNKARFNTVLYLLICIFSTASYASDIARSVRDPSNGSDDNGGYFELGFGATYSDGLSIRGADDNYGFNPELVINAGYHWQGLFLDIYPESVTPLIIGYNLMDKNNTSLDIVSGPQNGQIDAKTIDYAANIETRRIDYLAGLRLTHYYNDIIVQFEARKDISGTHDGEFYLFLTGQSWMLGNGTQHLLAGIAYQTASIVNYYLGVSPAEANALIPAYEANDAFIYKIEYGITYPLTPKWIVRTHVNVFQFDSAVINSPLMASTNNNYFEASATFNYVF